MEYVFQQLGIAGVSALYPLA